MTTLRGLLRDDELFVSWYIHKEASEVVTVVGDSDRLIASERFPLAPMEDLLRDFGIEIS